jgi:hypothetical protein
MADEYTETTTTSYGSRILGSLVGVAVGFVLFIGSFPLLYWNEGRVDLSQIAKTAIEIDAQSVSPDAALKGKLISTTGTVNSNESIGDGLYLKPDKYIGVIRAVEMYAWVENKETTTTKYVGGSETKETKYTYTEDWTYDPVAPASLKYPDGHENPAMSLERMEARSQDATVGAYHMNPSALDFFYYNYHNTSLEQRYSSLALNAKSVEIKPDAVLAGDRYIFLRKTLTGTFENPQVGDLRVSYRVLQPGFRGTVFGVLNGTAIDAFVDKDDNRLYRLYDGAVTPKGITPPDSLAYEILILVFRFVGFLLMWIGLMFISRAVSVLLKVWPILGTISFGLTGAAVFGISLLLSSVTIVVSMFLNSFDTMVVALVITVAALLVYFVMLKKKKVAATAS